MSGPAVRQRVTDFRDRPRRSIDEQIAVRFPRLGWLVASWIFRLPTDSGIRRRFVNLVTKRAYAGLNRRDLALNSAFLDPEGELVFPGGQYAFSPKVVRGTESVNETYQEYLEGWSKHRRVPVVIIDLGDRLLHLCEDSGRAAGSGIEVGQRVASLLFLRRGRAFRQEFYPDWESALERAGVTAHPDSPAREQARER